LSESGFLAGETSGSTLAGADRTDNLQAALLPHIPQLEVTVNHEDANPTPADAHVPVRGPRRDKVRRVYMV